MFLQCLLNKQCLQIWAISLQVNFYQIRYYEKGRQIDKSYAIKTNNFESDIIGVRDFYFLESPSWPGDFQQNGNKIDFILKSVYIETFAENSINIYFMQNKKVASKKF